MPAARYTFLPLSDDTCLLSSEFELYECGNLLVKFARRSVREKLESLGRGNNWIGSILRLLEKKYPFKYSCPSQNRSLFERIGEERLSDYLRFKGFRVFKNLEVTDRDIVRYLETKGYSIEGLLDDSYYSTPFKTLEKVRC